MTQQCSKKWSARAPPLHCPPEAHSTLRGPRIRHWFRPAHSVAFGARDHSQYIGTVFYLFTTKPPYFSLTGPWRAGDDSEADELSASATTVAATELLPSHIMPQSKLESLSPSSRWILFKNTGSGEVEREARQPRARQRHLRRGEPPAPRIMMSGEVCAF